MTPPPPRETAGRPTARGDRLRQRASTLLAWTIPILALSAFWLAIGAPLLEWRSWQRREAVRLERETERMGANAARLEADARRLAAQVEGSDRERGLFNGATPEQAAAQLQQQAARIVAANGARLTTATVLPTRPRPPFAEVGVRIAFETGHRELRAMLEALNAAEPFIAVRQLGLDRRVWSADPAAPVTLSAVLELAGLTRAAAPAADETDAGR